MMKRYDLGGRMKFGCFAFLGAAVLAAPAFAFERGAQADYDQFAFCYGQQAGAANALADDHENWMRVYPTPNADETQMIGLAQAMAVQAETLAATSAATFEDLDHPGYEMDFVSANKAYEKGYAFWADYMALPFSDRLQIDFGDDDLGMSEACWRVIFAIEALHVANAAAGVLVWAD